jgi:FkbM family methyltransferase
MFHYRMNWFASILKQLPFTVNVSGRKHDMICRAGRLFIGTLHDTTYNGSTIHLGGHKCAEIIGYAPANFFRDFTQSDLGKMLIQHLRPGMVFVDAGANLGGYSYLAKQRGADVHLFEPFPELASYLKENEHLYGKLYPIALSDQSGTATFHISDINIGGSSLVDSQLDNAQSGYTREVIVQTATTEQTLGFLPKIDWMKIDVEGNEAAVIQGCESLLREGRIEHIWCEVRGPQSDRNPNSYLPVCTMLATHGYKAYQVKEGKMHPFDHTSSPEVPQYFDLYFTKS